MMVVDLHDMPARAPELYYRRLRLISVNNRGGGSLRLRARGALRGSSGRRS